MGSLKTHMPDTVDTHNQQQENETPEEQPQEQPQEDPGGYEDRVIDGLTAQESGEDEE